jgi:hypothetical protein
MSRNPLITSYLKMRHDRDFGRLPCEWLKALSPAARKNEHFESTQVVLKLNETQDHKRTPTCANVATSRDGLQSKRLCGFRRSLDTNEADFAIG